MNARIFALAFLAALALGCPKRASPPAQTDDEQVDQLSAELEELRTRVQTQEPGCSDWCKLAKRVCDISRTTCDISARNADRADLQKKCVGSQEDCARFNDSCANCR